MNESDELWLDGVRRWYYGGSLPDDDAVDSGSLPRAEVGTTRTQPGKDRTDPPALRAASQPSDPDVLTKGSSHDTQSRQRRSLEGQPDETRRIRH